MGPASSAAGGERVRFADFELDALSLELWRDGELIPLRPQPASALLFLARRAGELVTREQLRDHLWGHEVSVDYEHSLNSAIRQVRIALGERAGEPGLLQTFPRRGYRLAAAVTFADGPGEVGRKATPGPPPDADHAPVATDKRIRARASETIAHAGVVTASVATPSARGRWILAASIAAISVVSGWALLRPNEAMEPDREPHTLVILPFVAIGDSDHDRLFGEGLSQEIIGDLGRLRAEELGVIAAASALRAGESSNPAALAGSLGADLMLLGTIRSEAETVRVTARLVDTADGRQRWAETFEGVSAETFQLQRRISGHIVAALVGELLISDPGTTALASLSPAYASYLSGRAAFVRGSGDDLLFAVSRLEAAVVLDPQLAIAWGALARALMDAPLDRDIVQRRVPQAIAAAFAAEAHSVPAHLARSRWRLEYDWDIVGALADADRAVALEPGSADARGMRAGVLSGLGRHDEATAELRRALALDPLSPTLRADAAWYLYFARRWDEAIVEARLGVELEEHLVRAWHAILYAAMAGGKTEVARQAMFHLLRDIGVGADEMAALEAQNYERLVVSFWDRYLPRLAAGGQAGLAPRASIVPGLVFTGRYDEAMAALLQAAEGRTSRVMPYLRVAPYLDALRGRADFRALVERYAWPDQPRP